jgi:hypothetical protein
VGHGVTRVLQSPQSNGLTGYILDKYVSPCILMTQALARRDYPSTPGVGARRVRGTWVQVSSDRES